MAARRADKTHLHELEEMRAERFELMAQLAKLPKDTVFFTQITMEAAEDPEFLEAMRKANIKGALVGVEAVTPDGLKDIYKDFNLAGDELAKRLRAFRSTACTCSARSSSACRPTRPRRSTRPPRWPKRPTSRSRSS